MTVFDPVRWIALGRYWQTRLPIAIMHLDTLANSDVAVIGPAGRVDATRLDPESRIR